MLWATDKEKIGRGWVRNRLRWWLHLRGKIVHKCGGCGTERTLTEFRKLAFYSRMPIAAFARDGKEPSTLEMRRCGCNAHTICSVELDKQGKPWEGGSNV
jgi:hypothetical protein